MLDVQNLCKSFDKKPFFTNLTFQVAPGECLVLLGRNGTGKNAPTQYFGNFSRTDIRYRFYCWCQCVFKPETGTPVYWVYPQSGLRGILSCPLSIISIFSPPHINLNKRERATAIDAVLELMDIEHLTRHQNRYPINRGGDSDSCSPKPFCTNQSYGCLTSRLHRLTRVDRSR